jgi:hypothetical protein
MFFGVIHGGHLTGITKKKHNKIVGCFDNRKARYIVSTLLFEMPYGLFARIIINLG